MITLNAPSETTENPINILHLEDSLLDHQLVCREIGKSGLRCTITRVETLEDFLSVANDNALDLVLADYQLPGFTALDAWSALSIRPGCPPFVLLSGAIGESVAVSAIKSGISDFISKDDMGKLARVILRTLEVHRAIVAKNKSDAELALSEKRLAEFAEYLQMTIENERASIAREIHDDIGGSLTAVNMDLAWINRHCTDPAVQNHIHAASEMLQHAMDASQRIMMNLRPSILDQGLFAAIQWLAKGFEKRTGIKTVLRSDNEALNPPKSVQLAAYRTAQEALTNASKYANCNQVRLEVSDANGVLTVEVTDDGDGIPKSAFQKPKAFGLRGLHERAKSIGGWLDVSSLEGAGTTILLTVPLDAARQPAFEEPIS